MVSLSIVIFRLLPKGVGKLLCTSAQRFLHKHTMSPSFPGADTLDPPPYCVGCGDMSSPFQYHLLEDNELIQVPLSDPYHTQLVRQGLNKATPDLPNSERRISGRA